MRPLLPTDFNPSTAALPVAYTNAKTALAVCVNLEEIKDWKDKAAALATYARLRDDRELETMATRIRARAARRAGELLQGFDMRGEHRKTDGTVSSSKSQAQVAREAGISERQQVEAVRIANVPTELFDAQVEAANPPTLTALADQGRKARPLVDLAGRSEDDFAAATSFIGLFDDLAHRDLPAIDLAAAGRGMSPGERRRARLNFDSVMKWMEEASRVL